MQWGSGGYRTEQNIKTSKHYRHHQPDGRHNCLTDYPLSRQAVASRISASVKFISATGQLLLLLTGVFTTAGTVMATSAEAQAELAGNSDKAVCSNYTWIQAHLPHNSPVFQVYRRIVEYKKKIALVEGKRRAMYNKFEREKTENRERERLIDDELKV